MDSTESIVQTEPFPIWATGVITIVVIAYLFFFVGGLASIRASQQIMKEAFDFKNIVLVARNVAQFPESLPPGYQYKLGIGVNADKILYWFGIPKEKTNALTQKDVNFLAIEHEPDKQEIVFLSTPDADARDSTEILNENYTSSTLSSGAATRFKSRKIKGEMNIAGHVMPYIIGELDDGESKEGLLGCINLKDQHRVLRIYGIQSQSGSYNLPETQVLLESIGKL
jgi:hypothetical protein